MNFLILILSSSDTVLLVFFKAFLRCSYVTGGTAKLPLGKSSNVDYIAPSSPSLAYTNYPSLFFFHHLQLLNSRTGIIIASFIKFLRSLAEYPSVFLVPARFP